MAAFNMVVGHELFHRKERVHRFFGWLTYAKTYYSQFYTAHIKFHHKLVATEKDPTTSRLGESLHSFVRRTLTGCYYEVWTVDKTWKSELFWQALLHVIIFGLIGKVFGPRAAVFSLLQAAVAIFMLETVNHIEHYGLLRNKDGDGTYEPVNIRHSWNAP
jgi:alkane 1-monooxygenase